MRPILVVTSRFIEPIEVRIDNQYEARRKSDGTLFTREELLAASAGADAILVTPFDRLDAEFFRGGLLIRQSDLDLFRWSRSYRHERSGGA